MDRVDLVDRRGVSVVRAAGELDAFDAPELASTFARVPPGRPVVVDLTGVSFLDSTALGAIVRGIREVRERGAEARVVLPSGSARRIFEITALDRALPVSVSPDEAVEDVAQSGAAG